MARNKYDVDEELTSQLNKDDLKRVLGYVKPHKRLIIITTILMLISTISGLFAPYFIKIAMDESIPNHDVKQLVILSVLLVAIAVVSAFCLKQRIIAMSFVGQSIIRDLRTDIFTHLQKLPFSYYDSRSHGKILVRVVNYVNSLSDLLSNGIINLFTDMFSLIFIVFFMLAIDVKLTIISLLGVPILMGSIFLIKTAHRKAYQKLSRKQSNMNAYIHESICGVKVTQSFAREQENMRIFRQVVGDYRSAWINTVKIQFLLSPIVDNVSALSTAALYIAGIVWLKGSVSVGVLIAFISYTSRFWAPINNMANVYNNLVNAMAYLERIFETIDEELEVENLPGATQIPQISGKVEFDHVSFAYDEGNMILKDVNFKVEPGQAVALVGPTGAGKTTIINLLSRFYNVTDGKLLIDGHDVQHVTLESLRKQMGVMLQDTFIFSGTILDNIRYGRLDATDEEVIEAAKTVRAHDFIKTLKDGYKTQVNERGSRLSAGQRQLISFARALLASPRILILDEATSSIDTKTELLLQQGLERLLKGRTSFIIAHRLSTIKNSDIIMYIDDGRIVERGTHDELIKLNGKYAELYNSQFEFLEAI